jgi:hypothetical protein
MSPLVKYLFLFLLNHTGPGASPYSFEVLPHCGTDASVPTCDLEPVCSVDSPLCATPRWSAFRNGWARVETQEAAAQRYLNAATALARTATYLTRCKDAAGNVLEECEPIFWPEGPRSAACAALGSSVWESGYREDIMVGAPPSGRGSAGEGCVMQVMPQYVAQNASWLTDDQRTSLDPEDVIRMTLGTDQGSLSRCYEAGLRMLSRFRRSAARRCSGSWVYSMYSMYGTGGSCYPRTVSSVSRAMQAAVESGQLNPVMVQGSAKNDWAAQRVQTYKKCMDRWPDGEPAPTWAADMLPPETLEPLASRR